MHSKLVWILTLIGLMACEGKGEAEAKAAQKDAAPVVQAPPIRPPSPEQRRQFVEAFRAIVEAHDVAAAERQLDPLGVVQRAMAGLSLAPEQLAQQEASVSSGNGASGSTLAQLVQPGIKVRSLGEQLRAGTPWQVFRVLQPNGGWDQAAFLLSLDEAGQVRGIDFELLSAGESMSETLRRLMLPVLETRDLAEMQRVTQRARAINEARRTLLQGKGTEALARLDQLPEPLRTDKSYWLLRAQIAAGLSSETYLQAVEDLAKHVPDSAAMVLHRMTANSVRKNHDEALRALATLAQRAAPDPFLEVWRAHILLQAQRRDEAQEAARRALAREPDLEEAYAPLILANLQASNFAAVTDLLLETHQKFGGMYLYETEPNYAKYAASREYKRLQKATAGEP